MEDKVVKSKEIVKYKKRYTGSIMNESINCRQIPIEYGNYTRTLIAVECLNLNNEGGNK